MDKERDTTKSSGQPCCGPSCCTPEDEAPKAKQAVQDVVREKYGEAVKVVMKGAKPSCCGSSAKESPLGYTDPITRNLYDASDTASLRRIVTGTSRSSRRFSRDALMSRCSARELSNLFST